MPRIKNCLHCGQPFFGRRDAKTCSTRCRKGLQRSREYMAIAVETRSPKVRLKTAALLAAGLAVLALGGSKALAAVSNGYVTDDKDLRQYMAVSLTGDNA